MRGYASYIKTALEQEPENRLFEANAKYAASFGGIPELSYYKTLERMSRQGLLVRLAKGLYYRPGKSKFGAVPISEKEIVDHYTLGGRGMVIGYKLYSRKGLTTQVSKRIELLSSAVSGQKKTIRNVTVESSGMPLTENIIPVIEALEILQNYRCIEDLSKAALAAYMQKFASDYIDVAAVYVLKHRRYKKATIALLERFLNYFGVENTLRQFLSALSVYAIPEMKEFYEPA